MRKTLSEGFQIFLAKDILALSELGSPRHREEFYHGEQKAKQQE
jgi:hypothetical protein